jgi:DNA-binding IclR family transcriptional regulator
MPDQPPDQRGVASKVMILLEAVAAAEHGTSVREVSRDTGIDKSTVSRILGQLQELGVVEQSSITGRFGVGSRLSSLGEVLHTHNSLWGLAEPIVRGLVEQFDETCYLVVREANQARFHERIDCAQAIRYVIEPGQSSALYVGAAGRAILSGIDQAAAARYLEETPLTALTLHTVTDRTALAHLVEEDRSRGYSVSVGERVPGAHGVASPVHRADGDCVGAILWTCPSSRFDATRVPEFGAAVREAAAELSRRLGWIPAAA